MALRCLVLNYSFCILMFKRRASFVIPATYWAHLKPFGLVSLSDDIRPTMKENIIWVDLDLILRAQGYYITQIGQTKEYAARMLISNICPSS